MTKCKRGRDLKNLDLINQTHDLIDPLILEMVNNSGSCLQGEMIETVNNCKFLFFCHFLTRQSAIEDVQRLNLRRLFAPIDPIDPCLVLHVARDNIVHSTLDQLAKQGSADFKKPLKIVFLGEEAIDAGGVKKVAKV